MLEFTIIEFILVVVFLVVVVALLTAVVMTKTIMKDAAEHFFMLGQHQAAEQMTVELLKKLAERGSVEGGEPQK